MNPLPPPAVRFMHSPGEVNDTISGQPSTNPLHRAYMRHCVTPHIAGIVRIGHSHATYDGPYRGSCCVFARGLDEESHQGLS